MDDTISKLALRKQFADVIAKDIIDSIKKSFKPAAYMYEFELTCKQVYAATDEQGQPITIYCFTGSLSKDNAIERLEKSLKNITKENVKVFYEIT
mgnify:FL=1